MRFRGGNGRLREGLWVSGPLAADGGLQGDEGSGRQGAGVPGRAGAVNGRLRAGGWRGGEGERRQGAALSDAFGALGGSA